MLIFAVVLFIIAAVLGVFLLGAILLNKKTNKVVLPLHGLFALLAIILVIIYMLTVGASPLLIASLSLFIMAALGGFTLASFDIKNKHIPKAIAVVHPLVALAGLICLVAYVLP